MVHLRVSMSYVEGAEMTCHLPEESTRGLRSKVKTTDSGIGPRHYEVAMSQGSWSWPVRFDGVFGPRLWYRSKDIDAIHWER